MTKEKLIAEFEAGTGLQQTAALLLASGACERINQVLIDAFKDGIPIKDIHAGVIRVVFSLITCRPALLSADDRLLFAGMLTDVGINETAHAVALLLEGKKS